MRVVAVDQLLEALPGQVELAAVVTVSLRGLLAAAFQVPL